jgi:hypothetical protein
VEDIGALEESGEVVDSTVTGGLRVPRTNAPSKPFIEGSSLLRRRSWDRRTRRSHS